MHKYAHHILIGAIVLLFASCTPSASEKTKNASSPNRFVLLEKAKWLSGTWKNSSPRGTSSETWNLVNDSTYRGASYFMAGTDTIASEDILLIQRGDALLYIPVVRNQNDGKPVEFTSTSISAEQLVFENPQHDFPQKITYTRISPDSLVAEISGTIDGQLRLRLFPMKKAD